MNSEVLVICHGGPISEPADAEYVISSCRGVDGFYGASSVERLPADRFRFRDPWGRPIPATPRPPPGSLYRLRQGDQSLAIDAATHRSGAGDSLDLDLAVEALITVNAGLARHAIPDRSDEARLVSPSVGLR